MTFYNISKPEPAINPASAPFLPSLGLAAVEPTGLA